MSTPSERENTQGAQVPDGKTFYSPAAQIGSRDKNVGYYEQEFSGCPNDTRKLLETYSSIATGDIDNHIISIRDKAWDIYPYPCIGQFRFLNLTLDKQPAYNVMLTRLKNGEAKYLDIGFCLGQDLRKLVADGAPSHNLYGAEVEGSFIDLGYELWRDRDTMQAHLIQADALDLNQGLGEWKGLMDYVHLAMVLHVFNREKQMLLLENCLALLHDGPQTMIVGEAVGDIEGIQTPAGFFMHSDVTLRQLCTEITERTGRHLDCRVALNSINMPDAQKKWGLNRSRRLTFEIRPVVSPAK